MTTAIVSATPAVCETCLGYQVVPNPARGAAWMACPACGGSDDPWPAAPALPAEPVGHLDVWAVAADEGACRLLGRSLRLLEQAETAAAAAAGAGVREGSPFFGGEVRVCDAAGNVWHRTPIRAAA